MPRLPTLRIWIGIRSKSAGDAGLARCITTSTRPGTHTYWLTSCSTNVNPRWPKSSSMLAHRAGDEVVDGDDLVAAVEQGAAEVRAEEPGAAGDDDAGHRVTYRPMPW